MLMVGMRTALTLLICLTLYYTTAPTLLRPATRVKHLTSWKDVAAEIFYNQVTIIFHYRSTLSSKLIINSLY